jgi:hypothetical protein
MWTSKGFLAPDPLTHAQKLRAQYYFQMNKITNPNRPDYGQIDFFMQQVYDGGTDPMSGKSPEVYPAADNGTMINSGEHMDHLTCGPDHTHTYNFNNGTCSTNDNVANRDQTDVNNTAQQHSDEIQLMLNTKTSCFGYANSDASYVRDDRRTLVSATTIDNFCDNDPGFASWLASKLKAGEVDKKCDDEFHRSFIGFDFDQLPSDKIYAGDPVDANGNIIYDLYNHGNEVDHINYHYYVLNGKKYHYLKAEQNQYCGQFETIDPEPNATRAAELIAEGWLPVYNSSNKKWVKVGNCNDGYFSDWIVTFMPATSGTVPPSSDVRIIAEDLNATAQDGDLENSDWDFNDVVFDVKFTSDNDAEITLIAAGGTLPLVVGIVPEDGVDSYPNNEVHALFGVPVNYMVNTNAEKKNLTGGAPAAGHEAPTINFTKTGVKASNGKDIPIYVQKTLKNGTKKWFQLTAEKGQPASKLAVNSKSSKFSYCDERQDITKKYTNFLSWVVNNDPLIWWEN